MLWEKQSMFSYNLSFLIQEINRRGYHAVVAEVYRTPEQAQWYFEQGKGIKDSLHCKKLAADVLIFSDNGEWLKDPKIYLPFGLFWEKLDPNNRAGVNFKKVDSTHFEMQDK